MIIDIHTHILPGVDDGAVSLEDAVEMAALAANYGITQIVATPHYNGLNSASLEELETAYNRLVDALEYEQIPIVLHKSMEILASDDLPELLQSGGVWTYPSSSYFLVEFSPYHESDYFDWLLDRCADVGFTPVIAHPERYHAVCRHPEMVKRWYKKGYGVQLNRDSLLGGFGQRSYECADYILRRGWANCIASDAHTPYTRSLDWSTAFGLLVGEYGARIMKKHLETTPTKILKNIPLKNIATENAE